MSSPFENYKILAEIGRGGMGIVYKANDLRTDRIVAIKQLILENIDPAKHKEFRDRFRREAQTALRLMHQNIVTVFEISQDPDSYHYVMEYLEGHSLRKEIAKHGGKCTLSVFQPILEQVAEGLSYAHSMNVIHRDVKPDNIFILEDGTVKVTDFGIARVADLEETNLTKTGVMLGTLAYVSPEQLQNAKTVDHRADIFSLGVVTYEALSGYLPFTGDGIAATIVKIMSQEELPLTSLNPGISPEVSGTVSRALRKRPRDRYRSVNEFIRDFRTASGLAAGDDLAFQDIDPFSTAADVRIPSSVQLMTSTDFVQPTMEAITDPDLNIQMALQAGPQSDLETEPEADAVRHPLSAEESGLSTETFTSHSMQDFGVKITLDKDGVLDERQKGKFSSSGKYKPLSQDKLTPEKPDDKPAASSRHNPTPPSSSIAARMAKAVDAPFVQPTYNPIKLTLSITQHGAKSKPFVEPAATSYRSGRLLVADSATRTIHMFSRDGRWLCDLSVRPELPSKTGGGLCTKPSGIAIDERGRIYVCDSSDHYIRIFDGQGMFIKEFKNIQGADGGLAGITIDTTGLLYVSDSTNGCLQVFQSDVGVWVRSIGSKGAEPGQLQLPSGLAVDKTNRIYVVDYGNCRVSVFNKSGALVRSFGQKGNQKGMFNIPRAVAIDKHDRIFVLDSLNHRIQVFGPAGDWLYTFGSLGSGDSEFLGPSGLSIDNENNLLFVADKGNKRIQVLELGFK